MEYWGWLGDIRQILDPSCGYTRYWLLVFNIEVMLPAHSAGHPGN
jgi:hypothetical protein